MLAYDYVPYALKTFFQDHPRVALAFSGGCDSSYVLACAIACKVDVKVFLVRTQFQYTFELDDAKWVANDLGVSFEVVDVDILSDEDVASNPPDRCYFCKRRIFGSILDRAQSLGITTLIDGTNATDDPSRRPGFRALEEYGVLSPLRIAGLSKDEIRSLSRQAGLITADKPNYSCLATRIPEGERIETDKLRNLSQEDWLDRS